MTRVSPREARVGLVLVVGLAGLLALVARAGGGPGFLGSKRTVDVLFRDGQGARAGTPVRIAGVEAGRVEAVDLVAVDGNLRARVRLSLPADLARRFRQDAKVAIHAGLTGQSVVNVVAIGRGDRPLGPGQVLAGVETSMFDPILEQVGLGPVERSHLSHTIAQVRETVDVAGPRLRQSLAALNEAADDLRGAADSLRPKAEAAIGHVEELTRRINDSHPEDAVRQVVGLATQAGGLVAENRPALKATLAQAAGIAEQVRDLVRDDRPKLDALLDGLGTTRVRLDQTLTQAHAVVGQTSEMITLNRANIDRTTSNIRDASDYGSKLVQKLFGNPFYLSPFYKPRPEDIQAQAVYDASNTFLIGAKEFGDTVKSLQAMRSKPMTPVEQKAYQQLFERAWGLTGQLNQVARQLGGEMNATPTTRR